ncbi:hypothetical protein Hte_010081 [Hypoxylon texense]
MSYFIPRNPFFEDDGVYNGSDIATPEAAPTPTSSKMINISWIKQPVKSAPYAVGACDRPVTFYRCSCDYQNVAESYIEAISAV